MTENYPPTTYKSAKDPELVQHLQETTIEALEELRFIALMFEAQGVSLGRDEAAGLRRMLHRIADRLDKSVSALPI